MSAAPHSARKILIADDEPFMREALGMILKQEGYEVVTAGNGAEAFEHLRGCGVPSLILLDLDMPVMNGHEFLARQVEDPALASIPIIVFTGSDRPNSEGFAGAATILRKPVEMSKLLATVRRLCA